MSASCWRKHKRALSVELVSFYLQIGLPNDACAFLAFFHQNQLARAKVEHVGADFGSTIFEWSKSQNIFHESAWSWEAGLRCCFLTSTCIILLWWLCSRTSHIKQRSSHIDTPASGKVLVISWPLCFNRRIQIAFIVWLHDIEANAARTLPEGPQAGVLNPVNWLSG